MIQYGTDPGPMIYPKVHKSAYVRIAPAHPPRLYKRLGVGVGDHGRSRHPIEALFGQRRASGDRSLWTRAISPVISAT
jgi:hypothetical protein